MNMEGGKTLPKPETEQEREAREAMNAYLRKWRSEHPEKVRKYNKDYWIKKTKREKEGNTVNTD